MRQKLRELGELEPNWDSYGAPRFDFELRDRVDRLLDELAVIGMSKEPHIGPCSDGSIDLEWPGDLLINISPDDPPTIWWKGEK